VETNREAERRERRGLLAPERGKEFRYERKESPHLYEEEEEEPLIVLLQGPR